MKKTHENIIWDLLCNYCVKHMTSPDDYEIIVSVGHKIRVTLDNKYTGIGSGPTRHVAHYKALIELFKNIVAAGDHVNFSLPEDPTEALKIINGDQCEVDNDDLRMSVHWETLTKQCAQQGFQPPICTDIPFFSTDGLFRVKVTFCGGRQAFGIGQTKKLARECAARNALQIDTDEAKAVVDIPPSVCYVSKSDSALRESDPKTVLPSIRFVTSGGRGSLVNRLCSDLPNPAHLELLQQFCSLKKYDYEFEKPRMIDDGVAAFLVLSNSKYFVGLGGDLETARQAAAQKALIDACVRFPQMVEKVFFDFARS